MGEKEFKTLPWILNSKYPLEKIDVVFNSLKCAAKLNVAFGFVLKNVENGSCRYDYAQDNFTLLEKSKFFGYQRRLNEHQESTK